MFKLKQYRIWFLLALLAMLLALPAGSLANNGYLTPQAPFLTLDPGVPSGSSLTAIINSGDVVNGFLFEGIPDGIGLAPNPDDGGTLDVFVAHEQTTVPFFNSADYQDASVSKLTLDTSSAAVMAAEIAIGPEEGYLRFCSASMAGPDEGFSQYTFFANEEANDVVDVPLGAQYGPDPALDPQRQAGYVVVLNAETGVYTEVAGMGRLNHENTIALPGWNQLAMLTTDDTFSGPSAQLYLYLANQESHVWEDKGSLWAFRVTRTDDGPVTPTDAFNDANDYLDLRPGMDWQGEFIRVPKKIARGLTGEAPQQALENWSNENNVFQFIRLEDLAYDKNDPRTVYIADTGASHYADQGAVQKIWVYDLDGATLKNGKEFANAEFEGKVEAIGRALDLDPPTTVECLERKSSLKGLIPAGSRLKYHFPAKGRRGPVTLYWFDGPQDWTRVGRIDKFGADHAAHLGRACWIVGSTSRR